MNIQEPEENIKSRREIDRDSRLRTGGEGGAGHRCDEAGGCRDGEMEKR